ncbi:putative tensin phosphatase, C2 domain, formin, FH2 domain, protein-tyrosine phosphatase [Helianthus debilis subsp. tardiflorus]
MALRELLSKRLPDNLVFLFERIYVFDCCFTTGDWEQDYKAYVAKVINQQKEMYPESSIMILDFREGDKENRIASALADYDHITIMDYPRHYEGCPLLSLEVIHHFLKSTENWLSVAEQNILIMHSELGGWPVLAFMAAALALYRKYFTVETKALEIVYKRAPNDMLSNMSPMNPMPSQLRYLQYVSRRNVTDMECPPADKVLTLDCVIMRMIPDFVGKGGCCPVLRIYGRDPLLNVDKTPKLLISTPRRRRRKNIWYNNQAESELVNIYINCHIQGDVVLECIGLDNDIMKEKIMYRAMFNTSFIESNTLILNRDEIDVHWDAKEQFHKDFRAELLFSEMEPSASLVRVDFSVEAFAKVQDMFGDGDWLVPKNDDALKRLHQMPLSDVVNEMLKTSFQRTEPKNMLQTLTKRNNDQDKEITVGPRSISLPRQLPSSTQTSIDASKTSLSLSSSVPPPKILLRETATASSTSPPPPPPLPNKTDGAPPPPPRKNLKPLNWSKINKPPQGSMWFESQRHGETSRALEFDMSELENLFSASSPNSD